MAAAGAHAQQTSGVIDKDAAKQQGGDLGASLNSSIHTNITTGNPATVVPGYNTTPSQTQYFQGGRGSTVGPGTARVTGCTSQSDVECQAVNLLQQGPTTRPQFNIGNNDPLVGRARSLTGNASAQVGDIFSTYDTCKTTTKTIDPVFETQVCNEFATNENVTCKMGQEVVVDPDYLYKCLETIQSQANRTCTVGRVVQVDADYNYQCQQSPKKVDTLTCNKTLIVTCDPLADGCENGGIVPGSTQGDMRVWFGLWGGGTYAMEFGTFGDDYWRGWGAIYDRTLTFNIANKDSITQFTLQNASFDDWLWVKINNNTVYVGPYGGDRLEIYSPPPVFESSSTRVCKEVYDDWGTSWICYDNRWDELGYSNQTSYQSCTAVAGGWNCTPSDYRTGMVQYCATCFRGPELKTSWNIGLNVDLRPYLTNGSNTIWMRTIVAGAGEGAIRILARMACPRNCYDNWDNQCQNLELRSQ